jgi:hypothetical protein
MADYTIEVAIPNQGPQGETGPQGSTTIQQVVDLHSQSYYRDFALHKNLNEHGIGPAITFTRASNATFFDINDAMQTQSDNTPRFDHSNGTSLGLLFEEQRTNSIRNSQAEGAVVGAPGSQPTNWGVPALLNGLSREIVGVGTQSGIAYIDIRYSGTTTAASNTVITPEGLTQTVAANGQSWTASAWWALAGGSTSGLTFAQRVTGRSSVGGFLQSTDTPVSLTGTLTRYFASTTFTNASTERVSCDIILFYASGAIIDITLRIASPQLERGAFATSYIPTTDVAATRAADSAVVAPISPFYNEREGTIYNEFSVPVLDNTSTLRGIVQFSENSTVANRLQTGVRGNGLYRVAARASEILELQLDTNQNTVVSGQVVKAAQAYKTGDSAFSINGATVVTSAAAITRPTRERLNFGDNGTAILSGHIRKVNYWPKRLSNTLLEQLTA